jgi:dTDP-4-dehydrorhamnose reductase
MRVLVTGAKGQMAQALVERAAAYPAIRIVAVGRPNLDMETVGDAARAIAAAGPDVVINAAAYTAVDQAENELDRAFRINAHAAGEVAAAAARAGASVIQLSTDYIFDGQAAEPYHELAAPNPLSVYGQSKLAGEEQVRAANPKHVVVRTAWVYSPFARNFVKTMMTAAQTRDTLAVVDDQRGSPSSALAVAEGLFRVVDLWRERPETGIGETYHLAGTGSTSWAGFAESIMAECRKRGLPAAEVRRVRTRDWPTTAARPPNSALDSSKFAEVFGYAMPWWQDSLATVIARLSATR